MPRVTPSAAQNPLVSAIFADIEQTFGRLPNLFKTYAHHPPLLEANWHKVKVVMMDGSLSRKVKETIAVLVSKDNSCAYCVASHTKALNALGVTDDELAGIEKDLDSSDFSAREKALIRFARQANSNPTRIPEPDVAALRATGASDAEIVEALGVMELFTAFNKFLDALEVDLG